MAGEIGKGRDASAGSRDEKRHKGPSRVRGKGSGNVRERKRQSQGMKS